ncbi:MAG: RnfABCDGE type electron transport complex subunit D [Candidatus Marinimicrobia bacterium]|nr:RnfABCDGE type electron transport complex subunit D [Candidatus Neomarinimicrobiota bacterium]MDD5582157.1 RnfABCDGE type electron transport complex subunit D [Candidatus Neomarinimicrobiota bacterium]
MEKNETTASAQILDTQKNVQEPPKLKKDPREKLYKPKGRPLILASSPFSQTKDSVPKIMWFVSLALSPTIICSVIFFGIRSIYMISTSILAALVTEFVITRLRKQPDTLSDGSAFLTGLLLALTLPPTFPISGCILGSVFAIFIGKQLFGGLGCNIFNPALLGRAFLQASFPVKMTTWTLPRFADIHTYSGVTSADAITGATPLGLFKYENIVTDLKPLFLGNVGGSLGETSALALLIGGIFLLMMRHADWRIPVGFLGSVAFFGGIFWLVDSTAYPSPLFHLLSGGLLLGAFFMATDMVTSPITIKGTWIYSIGAGILLVIIRLFGGLPEGVMYSILIMNGLTPLINRYTRPKFFGEARA